ncbi:MAG: hypothetical protein NTY80_01505 [candidate division SR1 bacterium]|nr:hypothetical protein [candidate division SR1 bacterium]
MQLFKRVLLSLFPDEIISQTINPASMFISFISTKEFFSVINRKIVENYKLNIFDIAIDPFEFKIGFGENNNIKAKDMDTYYGYCSTANLNGYRFFSPANVANNLSLVAALYVKDIFRAYPPEYYLNFLYTIFLLSFVFLSRIKVFPYTDRETNYNWFVETMFSFYEFVFQQTGKKADPVIIKTLKKELLNHIELFFLLFAVYKNFNDIFVHEDVTDKDFYSRLFYDELKGDAKSIYAEFVANHKEYTGKKTFSSVETKIMQSVLPADILLRYLFIDSDMFLITDTVISKIFDKKILDGFIKSFRKDDTQLEDFLLYITDYRNFKKNFFGGVQKYIITVFRDQDAHGEIKEDLNDLMSSIGEDVENIESFKIPERIKKESKMMEKILNFYITLIGGSRVSRGDNFFLRLFRKPIIQGISASDGEKKEKNNTLLYYGGLLYQYGKNVFFYKHTSENVRAGKQKFFLPHKTDIKNIYSNISLLKSFDETCIATILQDINPKDIRLYIKNKKIIEIFKGLIGQEISEMVKLSDAQFILSVYQDIAENLEQKNFIKILNKGLSESDIYHIKENIYNLDFRISKKFFRAIVENKINLKKEYSDMVILGIFSSIRETFSGFLIYITYLRDQAQIKNTKFSPDLLLNIYVQDILNIDEYYHKKIIKIINDLQADFNEIIKHWIEIDDNKEYLKIGYDNRIAFSGKKGLEEIRKKIISEDILRFKGFIKNITYYNKRFLMPQ